MIYWTVDRSTPVDCAYRTSGVLVSLMSVIRRRPVGTDVGVPRLPGDSEWFVLNDTQNMWT